MTGLMERHEKAAWMLRAQLETEDEETTQNRPFEYQDTKS
jgi:hypothetical protein